MLPITRLLYKFKRNLKGSQRLRAKEYWDDWMSDAVRSIIEGCEFVVQSVATGELMYAPVDHFALDEYRRRVFTWETNVYVPDGRNQEKWCIVPINYGEDRVFIQSAATREYLYATDWNRPEKDSKGRDQSHVLLWRNTMDPTNDRKYYWQIVPVGRAANPDVFVLYNCYMEEFLYSPDDLYGRKRRNVRTTKHSNADGSLFEERCWRLIPQNWRYPLWCFLSGREFRVLAVQRRLIMV